MRIGARAAISATLLVAAALHAAPPPRANPPAASSARMIVIAVTEASDPVIAAGSTPRGYSGLRNYAGSERATSVAAALADEYKLHQVSAWTIEPLRLRCILFEIPAAADRAQTLQQLGADRRVRLAQPLQDFETLTLPHASGDTVPPARSAAYNDPYFDLQSGFSAIDAGGAQRWSHGSGVRIALIDTGLDASHPDLGGRVVSQRDFVPNAGGDPATDRHGTEVAGVIVAIANNRIGIAGVAPASTLLSYRACWPSQADGSAARCNSYTLALALGAAIASGARIINLSLGGPADPLLEQLTAYAIQRGTIVVGAMPVDGRMDGFPVDVEGVIAVAAAGDQTTDAHALAAPGRDILTLAPGGHYDYASGSSLAAGHVTGAVALLLELDPHLRGKALYSILKRSQRGTGSSIDVCEAARTLRRSSAHEEHDLACAR